MATQRICSIKDCGKKAVAKNLCHSHYGRLRSYGDPLAGRTPNGDPYKFLINVILKYDGDECLSWPYSHYQGYGQIYIDGKIKRVNRIVCEHVHGPPPSSRHEAAHSCGKGDERCVTKGHLSWKTRAENEADKLVHGTHNRGERGGGCKLTESDIREILNLEGLETIRTTAARFGICHQHVSGIRRRKSWGWLK